MYGYAMGNVFDQRIYHFISATEANRELTVYRYESETNHRELGFRRNCRNFNVNFLKQINTDVFLAICSKLYYNEPMHFQFMEVKKLKY